MAQTANNQSLTLDDDEGVGALVPEDTCGGARITAGDNASATT